MVARWTWRFELLYILIIFDGFLSGMAYVGMRGRGVRTRGGRGAVIWADEGFTRGDNNVFAMLREPSHERDGDEHEVFNSQPDDGFTVVRGKRQRISTGGESNELNLITDEHPNYETLNTDEKLTLILTKMSLNKGRVIHIQNKLDRVLDLKQRVTTMERVMRSNTDRLKLLEYRSIDLEARSRRKNILFKGIPENRRENCFEAVRNVIQDNLNIDRDMYLERAHRLGRFDNNKIRPIIVAFRDFCDVEDILNSAPNLRGSSLGVCRDYPKEISLARQALWGKFKEARESNRNKKVSIEYPARLTVDNVVVEDMFPDWFSVLRGSRVDRATIPLLKDTSHQTTSHVSSTRADREMLIRHEPQSEHVTSKNTQQQPLSPKPMEFEENSQPVSPSILQGHMSPPPPPTTSTLTPQPTKIQSADESTANTSQKSSRGRSTTRKSNVNKTSRSISVRGRKQPTVTPTSARIKSPDFINRSEVRGASQSSSASQQRAASASKKDSSENNPAGRPNQQKSRESNADDQ